MKIKGNEVNILLREYWSDLNFKDPETGREIPRSSETDWKKLLERCEENARTCRRALEILKAYGES
jgi:hypothetical protein